MPVMVNDCDDLDEDRTPSDSAIGREDRTPPNLDLSCAVRPSVEESHRHVGKGSLSVHIRKRLSGRRETYTYHG